MVCIDIIGEEVHLIVFYQSKWPIPQFIKIQKGLNYFAYSVQQQGWRVGKCILKGHNMLHEFLVPTAQYHSCKK